MAKLDMKPPPNWMEMIENIRKVRLKYPAPVDSMGCDQASSQEYKPMDQRFHCLVSLMLSSQTKDPITWAATQKLKDNGLGSAERLLAAKEKDIEDLIYPVGFYRRKAIYLKKVAEILVRDYEGDIPRSVEDLCKLPGVGPKMAHLCMHSAWNEVKGIGVDTHVHRIAARLGWVPKKGIKNEEDTRKALESWLPFEYWREINHMLVGFGQTICKPIGPRCDECFNNALCPSAFKNSSKATNAARAKAKLSVKNEPADDVNDGDFHDSPEQPIDLSPKKQKISPRKTRTSKASKPKTTESSELNAALEAPKDSKEAMISEEATGTITLIPRVRVKMELIDGQTGQQSANSNDSNNNNNNNNNFCNDSDAIGVQVKREQPPSPEPLRRSRRKRPAC